MNFIELMHNANAPPPTPSSVPEHAFVIIMGTRYMKDRNISDATGQHNDDRLLAYLVHRLDAIVQKRYSIIYLHSDDPNHQMDLGFLHRAYEVLSRQYKRNLEQIWIVFPSFWIRLAWLFCKPFMDGDVTGKVSRTQQKMP
jgi:hypothetical protein